MSQSSHARSTDPLLTDLSYNVLKHAAAVGFPALSALYFALSQIWHFPKTEEVLGTIAAINVFIGALVGVSSSKYNNSDSKYVGAIEVHDDGSKKTFSLNLNSDPHELENMASATFKITPVQGSTPPSA